MVNKAPNNVVGYFYDFCDFFSFLIMGIILNFKVIIMGILLMKLALSYTIFTMVEENCVF